MISSSGLANTLDTWSETTGKPITAQDVEAGTWAAAEEGRDVHRSTDPRGLSTPTQWDKSRWRMVGKRFRSADHTNDDLHQPLLGINGAEMGKVFGLFCMAVSMAGLPAISLPLHWNAAGLPIGVQLVVDYGREDVLLQLARQMEEAFAWADRWPTVP